MEHVFLSGNQRSGKTLVHLVLGSHPDVSISPGTNVIAKVLYEMPRGRALSEAEMLAIRRVLQKDRKFKAWRVDHRAYQALFASYRGVTSARIVEDLMAFFRDQTKPGARWVGNKKGCYCKDGDLVKRVFPRAKMIFLLRDPRAAVSSMLETQPEHDLMSAALTWMVKARRIRTLAAEFRSDVFICRYEEFVRDPEGTTEAMTRFLGVDYVPEMLRAYRTNDAVRHRTDTTHDETYGPITTRMIDTWRDRLTRAQVAAIEGLCGRELERSGYERTCPPPRGASRARYDALRATAYLRWRASWIRKRMLMG